MAAVVNTRKEVKCKLDCEREYGLIRKIMSKIKVTGHFSFNEVGVQVLKLSNSHSNKYFWA